MNKKKIRYAILKEIDSSKFPITEEIFDVEQDIFDNQICFLETEGYISNVYYDEGRPRLFKGNVELTEKGENFLKENSAWAKAYKGLKEIKFWIK
ncbi:YjcQ family protein [Clostridium sp. Ade.TY]|uniref:YjcQ family protein n=1 Tax=Clostridium sp. Ade.TY TaxID=1391647 RepID=UPI0003F95B4B|nr:YjcQ family protein [Clostridium sp. Ade.TY]